MTATAFRTMIEQGDLDGIRSALQRNPTLANQTICWHLNQDNQSDPLHYVADCVGNGWLTNGKDGEITALLIEHGAAINGSEGRETPLIGAASLGASNTAKELIESGADLEATGLFGATALHWAAWKGMADTVGTLLSAGAAVEPRCTEFEATPLFWAVHGFGPNGPAVKHQQVQAAATLIKAGAKVDTVNGEGLSALEVARDCEDQEMFELLQEPIRTT